MVSLCFHSLMKLGIVAWYEINKDYVADVLCVNKDKPEMECNGKCYLKKQLTKIDKGTDAEKQNIPNISKKIEVIEYLLTTTWAVSKQPVIEHVLTHHAHYTDPESRIYTYPVFHPPSAV